MAVIADELLLNVKANVTQAMAGLTAVERKGAGLGGAIKGGAKVAGKAVGAVGIVAAGVGVASGKMALDFEENMAKIEALVGVPKDEMEVLEEAALRMGSEYGVGASEAAEGLFFLKSAGLETEDAISNMEAAAMANAIGLGTMEDLANTATTAMTNFGVDGEDAYDGIATAAKLAKADPAELGGIMNRNAATAALAGVEFDELGGVSALMTRKLGDASQAGTAISGVLNKIVKPSKQAEEMLGKVGMTSEDLKEQVSKKGLMGALQDLNGSFEEQGIATDEWAGQVFEDSRALKGAAAIIGTSGDELNEIMDGMNDKSGALEEGWETMAETGNVRLRKAFEGIKSALIPFGDTLQQLVVPMLESLAGWLEKGADWLSTFGDTAGGFDLGGIMDVLRPFAEIIGTTLSGDLQGLHEAFLELPESLWPLGEVVQEVAGFFKDLGEIGAEHIGWLEDTVADMVDWWGENWDDIQEVLHTFLETFTNIFSDIREWAVPFIKDFVAFIQEVFEDWIVWFKENWPEIKETVMVVLKAIQDIWERVWPIIQAVLEGVWKVIKGVVKGVMKAIQGIIETVMALIRGDWDAAWEGIKKFFAGIWDALFEIVRGGIENTWKILKEVLPLIKEWWDNTWDKFKDAFRGLFEGAIGIIRGPANAVLSFIEGKINSLIDLINSAISSINKIPGVHFDKLSRVSIPKLAGGGVVTRAGMALINDSTGPESIGMAAGAMVRPSSPGDRASGPLVHIEHMHGQDPHQVASDIGWELTKRGAA